MSVPKVDQAGNGAVDALVQTASKQAVVLAREQVDVARRELTSRARQAVPAVAMVGGGAVLAAMASGTGTAGMILLLAGRPRPAAAAFGVTGAYAGAGALLARQGLGRLREAGPLTVPEAPVPDAEQGRGSAKRSTKAAKSAATKSSNGSSLRRARPRRRPVARSRRRSRRAPGPAQRARRRAARAGRRPERVTRQPLHRRPRPVRAVRSSAAPPGSRGGSRPT